jgi:hypothetical protein
MSHKFKNAFAVLINEDDDDLSEQVTMAEPSTNKENITDNKSSQLNHNSEEKNKNEVDKEEDKEEVKEEDKDKDKYDDGDENKSETPKDDRKSYRDRRSKFNKHSNSDQSGEWAHVDTRMVDTIKHDDKLLDNKKIYEESEHYGEIGNDKKLNDYWTVWVHKNDCKDWTLNGYQKRYIINNIGSFWRFFNNFQFYDTVNNQFFIMREEIAPIWEDLNNKFGGLCSLKIDSVQRGFKTDISVEIFNIISMLIMNETFIQHNENINGISFCVKRKSAFIKIWTKVLYDETKFIEELPKTLMNKFNTELQKQIRTPRDNFKISIQYKEIKPEYDI